MADLAEHSEELAELERRVEELEHVIGTQKDGDSINEAVKSIDAQLSARVTPDQRKLFEIYSSHKQLVEQPFHFAASDADIAMEHLEDIRSARLKSEASAATASLVGVSAKETSSTLNGEPPAPTGRASSCSDSEAISVANMRYSHTTSPKQGEAWICAHHYLCHTCSDQ